MITVRKLESGYYMVEGDGPCEWAQPPSWPCDETTLLAHTRYYVATGTNPPMRGVRPICDNPGRS